MTLDKELRGTSFNPYTGKRRHAVFMAIYGPWKSRKTSIAIEAPGPVAFMGIELGHRGIVDPFVESGHAVLAEYHLPDIIKRTADQDEKGRESPAYKRRVANQAVKVVDQFIEDYEKALNAASVRTIVWDTGDEFWECFMLARHGSNRSVPPLDRARTRSEYSALLRRSLTSDKNLIVVAKESEIWKGDKGTGRMKPKGHSETGFLAEVLVETSKKRRKGDTQFFAEIVDCRVNREAEGVVVDLDEVETTTFATIMGHVLPDVPEEAWL